MKTDQNGCSTCLSGKEQWEEFIPYGSKETRVQYDYRTPSGKLFSCIARDLADARTKKNIWLFNQEMKAKGF